MPFTVKLTGGPDGDVAGNMLKILHRDYPTTARVVGMADGTGCAEDPNGLPLTELLRLFKRGDPLAAIDGGAMSPSGVITLADTPTGAAKRNTMYNHVIADAFVPAGGRPATMHAGNWRDFLLPDGTPSAKCIVEGANLFLTAEARQGLFDACGLPIVKDSSANKCADYDCTPMQPPLEPMHTLIHKHNAPPSSSHAHARPPHPALRCGVVCSSMEIVASMSLSDDEFLDMKPVYVDQVGAAAVILRPP